VPGYGAARLTCRLKNIEFLCEPDALLDGLLRLNRQTEDERAVNDDTRAMAVFREPPHFIGGHAFS